MIKGRVPFYSLKNRIVCYLICVRGRTTTVDLFSIFIVSSVTGYSDFFSFFVIVFMTRWWSPQWAKTYFQERDHSRDGSRIPRRRGANHPGGGANIWFCQILRKTAWNWENFGPWGGGGARGTPLNPPLHSILCWLLLCTDENPCSRHPFPFV